MQVASGFEMFGDQRRVVVSRPWLVGFDRGRQPPVHLGAIRFQLGFVGHGADQRMMEHILGLSGKCDLVDELAAQQVLQGRINAQRFQ
jgi:hypothetical protein